MKGKILNHKLTANLTFFLLNLFIVFVSVSCTTTYSGKIDAEVSKLLEITPPAESYPDADIIYLLDEDIEEVFNDGKYISTVHNIFKIVSERGKDYADCEIPYNSRTQTISLLYARTITPDGKIIPLKKNAIKVVAPYSNFPNYSDFQELTFSMPGVSIDCVIDYKYVIEKEPIIQAQFADNFFIQWYYPILLSRYSIITPENMDLKYHALNPIKDAQRAPKVIHRGGKNIYLWEHRDIPQIFDEDYMPPMEEIAFNISVTTMESWEEFFHWWRKLIKGKTDPNEAIRKIATELTRDLSSSRDKIEAIFDYVKREVRYVSIDLGKSGYVPEPAPEVFENKYGDCKDKSTLLISMLKAAGIPAHYVLIPTHDVGNLIKHFPYPFQFDHCIVATEKEPEGYRFLDPVYENHPFDYLPGGDQNRDVVIFKLDETVFATTPLAKPEESTDISRQQITVKEDGTIEVEEERSFSGSAEARFRTFFNNASPIEIKELFLEAIDEISPGAKLLDYAYSDPLDFKQRLTGKLKYIATHYCKKAGDILIFQVPRVCGQCLESVKQERKHPVLYESQSYSKNEVSFNIPEGYYVYHLPEPVEIKNPYFEYRSSYRKVGEGIFYQDEHINKAVRIPPEEYTNYHKFCKLMENSCERYVLFREQK